MPEPHDAITLALFLRLPGVARNLEAIPGSGVDQRVFMVFKVPRLAIRRVRDAGRQPLGGAEISAEIRAYQRGLASIWRPAEIRIGTCRNKGLPTGIGLDFGAGRNKDWAGAEIRTGPSLGRCGIRSPPTPWA